MDSPPISRIFPPFYAFMFLTLEPAIIATSMIALVLSPTNFFISLAPDTSSGALFHKDPSTATCGASESWNTPQLRALHYQYMSAFAFSAVIEPLMLFIARYRISNSSDAEQVIRGVLLSFLAFDAFHAFATAVVVGLDAVLPWSTSVNWYSCINVWVPVAWMIVRTCWLVGAGRGHQIRPKKD
ncbi:hypothetical protein FDECE_4999 [Fusarium decemcellulare]|nr:hypothetical protein FDECE_4999 [Fusarium decemcellulare]